MQSRVNPEGWVRSEGIPPLLWMIVAGDFAGVVALSAIVSLDSVVRAGLGTTGAVATVVALVVADAGSTLWFANLIRPTAVRGGPQGIELQSLFGAPKTLPWSRTTLGFPRSGSGFVPFRAWGNQPSSGMVYYLTTDQAVAIRSSPHRPAAWPPPWTAAPPG